MQAWRQKRERMKCSAEETEGGGARGRLGSRRGKKEGITGAAGLRRETQVRKRTICGVFKGVVQSHFYVSF